MLQRNRKHISTLVINVNLTKGKVLLLLDLSKSPVLWHGGIIFYEILGNHLGFQSYLADTGVWFKAATDKTRNEYYIYIIVYVDDLLIFEKYL